MKNNFVFRGVPISYRDEGSGRALILLHGFLASHRLWDDQFEDLTKRYRVIAPDLPGHGDSGSLGYLHSMELMAEMVHALIKHLGLRKVVLLGHSLGGYVSLAFAEKYTDKLKGLILLNSTAAADTAQRKVSRDQLIKMLPKKFKMVISSLVESFFVIYGHRRITSLRKYKRWALQCDPKGIAANVRGMKDRKEREIILKFAPYPYLIIGGDEDPIISIEQSEAEARLNPLGELIMLEDSGHMTPLEKPWFLNKLILNFLRERVY
ncbi:MAG: alpha/beta hydrolase [Flavobacteriales bacterium]|nr:alpha/beta hydrolase [Flavobacteriales bacterium]|tara:strand:+ start:244 stop:1038 length:795 start_codon:yes stop_codon:yes gene_type:complete